MIRLVDVCKTFSDKKNTNMILKDVNMEIHRGDIFGFMGYSGAGKSTVLRLINGLEKPTRGSIALDQMEISTLKPDNLRKMRQKIGMVFQHFHLLWSRTVRENVAFPIEITEKNADKINEKVNELLKRVGLENKSDAYPSTLSGGQKQRVGIARALANDPDVLLCDEITSALDNNTTLSILELLKEIHGETNITIVFVSHEIEIIRAFCNRVAVLNRGMIVEYGSAEELFTCPQHIVTKQLIKGSLSLEGESAC